MDKTQVLAIARLAEIAEHHEMPLPVRGAFIAKCVPDILSGNVILLWQRDFDEHSVMQEIEIDHIDLKKMENENDEKSSRN